MASQATLLQRVRATEDRYFLVKRLVDVTLALSLFLVALPVMVLVGMLVALDSDGPILYRQKRVGQDGVEFDLFKFRSMTHNADDTVHRAAVARFMRGEQINDDPSACDVQKIVNDPRVTRIGKFIRKTSLDELPQLWNIVIGDMSLVGPRPPVPYEVTQYSPRAMQRLDGKPGLTGPWQVYGRGTVTFAQMIEMDVNYLRNRSIWYDLKLVVLTVPAVIKGRGAE